MQCHDTKAVVMESSCRLWATAFIHIN